MMRKTITRKLVRTTINSFIMKKVDGEPVVERLEPVTAWGKLKDTEAQKLLADIYGKHESIMIDSIKAVEETYQIDIDKFVANAVKVEPESLYSDTDSIVE